MYLPGYDKGVSSQCTCGVQLVEDARFCHKCGRPVGGVDPIVVAADAVEEQPPADVPVAPAAKSAVPPAAVMVGFQNSTTIRTALHASLIMFFGGLALTQVVGSGLFLLVALLATGVLAVFLYRRRTGYQMTPIEGARHGWISGLFFFLFTLVAMTFFLVIILNEPDAAGMIREQVKAQGSMTPEISRMLELIAQPGQLAMQILAGSVLSFVLFTALSSLGGVLGARLFSNAKPRS